MFKGSMFKGSKVHEGNHFGIWALVFGSWNLGLGIWDSIHLVIPQRPELLTCFNHI
jgi:hypothetical protein